tara:strand:- start:335 stop:490 length:156 start_codon:yes stop_codon:yes gene_type:complete
MPVMKSKNNPLKSKFAKAMEENPKVLNLSTPPKKGGKAPVQHADEFAHLKL